MVTGVVTADVDGVGTSAGAEAIAGQSVTGFDEGVGAGSDGLPVPSGSNRNPTVLDDDARCEAGPSLANVQLEALPWKYAQYA